MIFYFSSTGNSKALAQELSRHLDDEVVSISPLRNYAGLKFDKHETIGFVFPVYAWNVPTIVEKFIAAMAGSNISGKYIYAAMTCGDDVGMIDKQLNRLFKQSAIKCNAFFSVCMPNTYVCLPGFDVDKDPVEQEKLNSLHAETQRIALHVKKRESVTILKRGVFPYTKTYLLGKLFKTLLLTDKYFHTTSDCISCNKCVEVCPNNNISIDKSKPAWNQNCIGCLSCYHHCPVRAIRFGKITEHKGQYCFTPSKLTR